MKSLYATKETIILMERYAIYTLWLWICKSYNSERKMRGRSCRIYVIRLLYYLPMERMTTYKEALKISMKRYKELEEENKKLKKYYDRDKEELMESCYSLARENDKLKSDLSECECSFWFESDEVWYRKREYKRLKKWIKDHCNGYWNLFPEDEMKRQWKKADKKRKKAKEDDELIYEEWLYD